MSYCRKVRRIQPYLF